MVSFQVLQEAAIVIQQGGIVAFPTETYYGLGVDPFNEAALDKLYKLKKRPSHKPLLTLISHLDQLLTLAAGNGDLSGKDRQRERDEGKPLTSSSTVNRLELTPWNTDENTRYKKIIAKPGTGSGILRPRDIAASIWRQRARANVDYLPSA